MDPEYLLLFRGSRVHDRGLSPDEMQAYLKRWWAWMDTIKTADQYVTGRPLIHAGARVSADTVDTDGPFAESREVVGGFVIVRAADLDAAIAIAKRCPIDALGGSVEVRPLPDAGLTCEDVHESARSDADRR